jgi:2-oxoglutarate ferredoxin oxidoreductase subunit alpha
MRLKRNEVRSEMAERVLLKNNEVIAESAIRAGCRCFFGYPITPQNEITEYFAKRLPEEGGVFIQSESEIAAINMVAGASSGGVRAMTSTSSPGMSLMAEGISFMATAELPGVIVNISRAGPGDGDIKGSQGDYFQATKGHGHGDYRVLVLAPNSGKEITELTALAFDLADKYRTPVILLGDGYLGQMIEPVILLERIDLSSENNEKKWALTGAAGRKPNQVKSCSFTPKEAEAVSLRLQKKFRQMTECEQRCEVTLIEDAQVGIVAFGIVSRIARSVVQMAREKGLKVGLIRPISLWPFPSRAFDRLPKTIQSLFVVEMNAGQMLEDVRLEFECKGEVYFHGRVGGMIPSTKDILGKIEEIYHQ